MRSDYRPDFDSVAEWSFIVGTTTNYSIKGYLELVGFEQLQSRGYMLYLGNNGTFTALQTSTIEITFSESERYTLLVSKKDLDVQQYLRAHTPRVYNYPNPVSSYTTFVIDTDMYSNASTVSLSIYTLKGEKVYSTIQPMSAVLYWDVRSNSGRQVESGLYFYELKFGNTTLVNQLLVQP